MNRFGAALSVREDLDEAVAECIAGATASLDGERADLALVFANPRHSAEDVAARIAGAGVAEHLIGCIGETVVGPGREVEDGPALSLWLARLPAAKVVPFELGVVREEDGLRVDGLPALASLQAEDRRGLSMLLIADPFSFPADDWLRAMNGEFPGLPIFGGMASGGHGPGQSRLLSGSTVRQRGAVGVMLEGVAVRTVVSQGCRPVGKPMIVTKAHDNVIEEVAGKPPLVVLQSLFDEGSPEDRLLIQRAARSGGLHIGQVVDEYLSQPGRGDFLVRNVMGADHETGAVMISDYARVGRTVCFHVRDAETADEDLHQLLEAARESDAGAGLLFSCNGRGTRMFETADHDAACVQTRLGEIPLAGFFAAGEIGPVGGNNFLHGFTASLVLFPRA